MKKVLLSFLFFALYLIPAATEAQGPPEEFFTGLDLLQKDAAAAEPHFRAAVHEAPLFSGSYHFLGVIKLDAGHFDSAVYFLRRSVDLNEQNANHTKELSFVRLINAYLYLHDFSKAFETAKEAYLLYPENKVISSKLKDVCFWAVYIHHNSFDISYLAPDIKPEYLVNDVSQEYLVIRTVRIDGEPLSPGSQSLISKGKSMYDVLDVKSNESDKKAKIYFKLNWDFAKDFSGKPVDAKAVMQDKNNPVYDRIGAKLTEDPKADLGKLLKEN